jgi:exodeoxyribonuclease-5
MSISLSAEQERARCAILANLRSPHRKQCFFLIGPAGSGKSSVIMATTESVKGNVIYVAPTAKAALVMRRKGCPNPRTIHNLLYRPAGMSGNRDQIEMLRELRNLPSGDGKVSTIKSTLTAQFTEELKTLPADSSRAKILKMALASNLNKINELVSSNPLFTLNLESDLREASLLVIDEVSMLSAPIMDDILSFGVPVLAQGDLNQLPPVRAVSYFADKKPDFELTEVHRQAKDSPIIYLATLARQGLRLPLGAHGNCLVTNESLEEEAMAADQVIVGTHKMRWGTNDKMRGLLGFTSQFPVPGDRLICRSNNHKLGLLNGDQFKTTSFKDMGAQCRIGIENEELSTTVTCHREYFFRKEPNPWTKKSAECMDFSYAITCHSAQGSQWPTGYVRDESKTFKADSHRWLYTALTRFSEKVVVRV